MILDAAFLYSTVECSTRLTNHHSIKRKQNDFIKINVFYALCSVLCRKLRFATLAFGSVINHVSTKYSRTLTIPKHRLKRIRPFFSTKSWEDRREPLSLWAKDFRGVFTAKIFPHKACSYGLLSQTINKKWQTTDSKLKQQNWPSLKPQKAKNPWLNPWWKNGVFSFQNTKRFVRISRNISEIKSIGHRSRWWMGLILIMHFKRRY